MSSGDSLSNLQRRAPHPCPLLFADRMGAKKWGAARAHAPRNTVPPAEAGSGFIQPAYPGLYPPQLAPKRRELGPRSRPGLTALSPLRGWFLVVRAVPSEDRVLAQVLTARP